MGDDETERGDPGASPGPRPSPARRRATLLDVMVLVAVTALGLALSREIMHEGFRWESGEYLWWVLHGPPAALAACWALGLLVLRIARPRPRWRRIVRQPGWVACASTVASILLGLGTGLGFAAVHTEAPPTLIPHVLWMAAIEHAPAFVTGTWVALWLSGRWSPERTWLDRAGRVLGMLWIASLALDLLGPALRHFFRSL